MCSEYFELGKSYIVEVTKKGIIPLMEFDNSAWYNKDHDDIEFLTDEEKIVIIDDVLHKIRAEIEEDYSHTFNDGCINKNYVLSIIDKYMSEGEE